MIPPYVFYQIYPSLFGPDDCTPSKCGEMSEYTDSTHTEVEDPSSRCMNVSDECSACKRIASLPRQAQTGP